MAGRPWSCELSSGNGETYGTPHLCPQVVQCTQMPCSGQSRPGNLDALGTRLTALLRPACGPASASGPTPSCAARVDAPGSHDANNPRAEGSTGCPQVCGSIHSLPGVSRPTRRAEPVSPARHEGWAPHWARQIDPHPPHRVPLAGRNRIDRCCVLTTRRGAGREAAGGVARTTAQRPGRRPDFRETPEWSEHVEQADLPAEQPATSQDARLPPAHAHPRGARDPFLAPPQGPRSPRCLSRRRSPS